ncbi:hypothetical protein GE061_017376 [Apolygus lucorum]|uniref:Lipid-binding serum glycoprotein N-terminal domain-containing protein n=1 Tax=Apolygus lucorum TaxID=248454 RepID=A0A8S9XCY7_APOLU|nr:hypothetical protein GE061_017376 [Apolygus lucorum]
MLRHFLLIGLLAFGVEGEGKSREYLDKVLDILITKIRETNPLKPLSINNKAFLPKELILKHADGQLGLQDLPNNVSVKISCVGGQISLPSLEWNGDAARVHSDEFPNAKLLLELPFASDNMVVTYPSCVIKLGGKKKIVTEIDFLPHARFKHVLRVKYVGNNCSLRVVKSWFLIPKDQSKIKKYGFTVKYGMEKKPNKLVEFLVNATIKSSIRFHGNLFFNWLAGGKKEVNDILESYIPSDLCVKLDIKYSNDSAVKDVRVFVSERDASRESPLRGELGGGGGGRRGRAAGFFPSVCPAPPPRSDSTVVKFPVSLAIRSRLLRNGNPVIIKVMC